MFKISHNLKGILTIASGVLIHLVLGSCYSYSLFSPYLLSYLNSFSNNLHADQGFWFVPISISFTTLCLGLGSYLENKLGPRM